MHKLLQSEIDIIKSLNHNNILKCKDVFITVNSCYIITELCEGGDLAS
jgi:serine/threonine protein kinase